MQPGTLRLVPPNSDSQPINETIYENQARFDDGALPMADAGAGFLHQHTYRIAGHPARGGRNRAASPGLANRDRGRTRSDERQLIYGARHRIEFFQSSHKTLRGEQGGLYYYRRWTRRGAKGPASRGDLACPQ